MTVCRQRIMFAELVARVGEERLPRRVVFGEMSVGKGYSFGHRRSVGWGASRNNLEEFGIKSKGRREAAHTRPADRWFRCVEDKAGAYMRKWHHAKKRTAQSDTWRLQPRHRR